MKPTTKIFVRVLSEGIGFGAWAPIEATPKSGTVPVFILTDNSLSEDDEYEFFEPGTEVRVATFTDFGLHLHS
ncbi:MAG: hypothetical protein ACKV1O_18885 [Saprospiraceae bacterium]